jgi:hypothetical protein
MKPSTALSACVDVINFESQYVDDPLPNLKPGLFPNYRLISCP